MRVRLLVRVEHDGQKRAVGDILDVRDADAAILVSRGVAERVEPPKAEAKARA